MKIKFVFLLLISLLASNLLHAQSGCSNVYYYDNDSDGYGTSAVFSGGTSADYGAGQYLGWSPLTFSFPTPLNNLSSFYYSVTNTAATSDCWFYFYSGGNVVGSLEINPYNGLTFNSNHSFPSPLNGVTSVVIYSYWNPSYLNDLTFTTIPSSVTACTQPIGYASNNTDCNDGNSAVNPGIFDNCNSIDDNCDGQVDNGRYYADLDGDGYGVNSGVITQVNSTVIITSTSIVLNGSNDLNFNNSGTDIQSQISFVVPTTTTYTFNWSYVTTDPDGPELDPAYYINNVLVQLSDNLGNDSQSGSVSINVAAGSTFGFALISADGIAGQATLTITNFNGMSNITNGAMACSAPVGYVTNNSDCNDNLSAIHPGATEICNSFDDDCDSQVDDGVLTTYYADTDGDGYGVNSGIITQGNSTIVVNNNQIIINGSDSFIQNPGGAVQSNISFVVPQNATYTFDWSYVTTDEAPEFDPAYYINNTLVPLSNEAGVNSQSGSVSVAVNAGSTFGFAVVSTDGVAGSATLTITNFSGMNNITAGVSACSAPAGGYVANNDDCNDSQNNINPGVTEFCNSFDEDCDGQIDEGLNTYYADNDGDGFGAGPVTITCEQPVGFVLINGDCNDNSVAIKPSATELCNSVDDDCDGIVDDGVPLITRYLDNDGDGYGNVLSPSSNCFGTFPSNYVVNSTDCNDNLSAVNPAAIEVCNNIDDNCNTQIDEGVQGVFYADADGDGFGSSVESFSCSAPTGFVANNADCNDGNSLINPGATEVCNTIDDNCDGQIDVGLNTYYADNDGDGFGAGAVTITCSPSAGFVLNNTDCNDNASAVYPGAAEICNSIDDNCDTQIDEGVLNTYYVDTDGDGYGFDAVTESFAPGSWVLYTPSAFVLVGTQELWIGVSNSIQFVAPTTETYTFNWAYAILDDPDQDPAYYFVNNQVVQLSNELGALYQSGSVTVTVNAGDVFGFGINSWDDEAGPVWLEITNFNARPYMGIAVGCSQPTGYAVSNNDCDNSNAAVNPGATEICNNIDDNCDSEIDEDVQNTYYADTDGDGFGGNSTTLACTVPTGYSTNNLDCNENVASINPGANEMCNSIDDNCNGQSDEGVQSIFYYDGDNDGFGTSAVFSGTTAQNYGAGQYLGSWGYTVNFPTTLNNLVSFNYSITNTAAMSQCVFRFYNGGNLITTVEAYPQNGETINTIYNFSSPLYNVTSVQVFSYWNPAYLNSLTFSSFPSSVSSCTQPAGYTANNTDCNDGNASVNPGAIEICNTLDDDCDLGVDNALLYVDADNDGYGDASSAGLLVCVAPTSYVANNDDCDDTVDSVYLGSTEVCNTIDDDCDTQIDEGVQNNYYADTDGDGFGAGTATLACTVPNGFVTTNTDCNNTNASVFPGATEVCNTIDDDCDSQIDEGVQNSYYADTDGDGYGAGTVTLACTAPTGFVSTNTDCNNTNGTVNPGATEVCNSIDDDCDTQIDEGVQNSFYADIDGDGFGSGAATMACTAPNGMVGNNTDCDDASAAVYPGAFESCNSIDDDCDGGVDEFGTTPAAQVVTSCGPYTWSVNNTSYNTSGTYYANVPAANTYDSYASFTSASSIAGYQLSQTEDFSEFGGYFTSASGNFGAGFPSWSATGVSGFFAYEVNGSTAIAANQYASALTFNFSTGVTGVGGNFFVSDVFGNVISNTVNITLSDGTTQSLWIGSSDSFTGYISNGTPITSITINTPWISQTNPYVRVDNLVVLTGTPVVACSANVLQLTVNTPVSYFADSDGDGYGAGTATAACTAPAGYVATNTDCDNTNAALNPGATEVCNSIDDDCDTQIDEGVQNNYYADMDGDSYGAGTATAACTAPAGYVATNTDCDNTNSALNPGATEVCNSIDDDCDAQIDEGVQNNYYADTDGDGYGSGIATLACTAPTGFVTTNTDCNNNNASVNPGATEVCNTIDDDCDTQIDEGVQNNYYADTDGDGYGAGAATLACTAPTGYVTTNTDCNNTNAAVNPAATEVCNSIDDDCDTQIDEGVQNNYYVDTDGDGYGAGAATLACTVPTGFVTTNTDCNDTNASINPGATEVCNSIDEDCDAQIDEGVQNNYYADTDGDGYGSGLATLACTAPTGFVITNTDCNNNSAAVNPAAIEVCNSIDDDCDTQIDEGLTFTNYYADVDGDGYGAGTATNACSQPVGFVTTNTDCNNNNASVNPAATEVCNTIDDDCDTQIDEGVQNTYYVDIDGDGYAGATTTNACTLPVGYFASNTDCNDNNVSVNPSATEICNSIDDNCDGQFDEGLSVTTFYPDNDGDGFGVSSGILTSGNATIVITQNGVVINGSNDITNNSNLQDVGGLFAFLVPNTTVYTFNWNYSTNDAEGPQFDVAYYINSDLIQLSNNNGANVQSGTVSVTVNAGSVFGFAVVSEDNIMGGASLTITNFNGISDYSGGVLACAAPVGYVSNNTDCSDELASINPSANEICNSADDDCDTQVDEGLQNNYYVDTDGDGYGAGAATAACTVPTGYVTTNTDCNNTNAAVNPGATEVCGNGVDENCNASDTPCVILGCTDVTACNYNPLANSSDASCIYGLNFYADTDGDGYGAGTATVACTAPIGMVANNTDCNNTNASLHPGATEICNMVDEDCDTQVDEGLPLINYYSDVDADTYGGALVSTTCSILTGYVTIGGDCNDNNVAINPGAVEVCINSIDDDCDGIVNDGCLPDQLLGESPATSQYVWTNFFPSCVAQSHTLTGFTPSLSSQSICLTGEDKWHYFTANSEAVSIQVSSTANDILLELQNANGTLVATENAVAGLGGEILNFSGLTAGQIYKVGVRNYNSALGIGAYSICIKMLKRGGCDYGSGPYTLCQYFKAAFAGAGAVYTFTFTGVSGPATGNVYTRTQTSDICVLSNVSPALPYGSTYNVLITSTYNLLDGAGNSEIISVPALSSCTMITAAQPVTALRTTDQCSAGPRFRGAVVAALPWVCGATNWRWEFTELNTAGQPVGLPISVNRGAASNYINLGTVSALQHGKTYAVRTAPILPYTGANYQWGPTFNMCIIGSAGMVVENNNASSADTKSEIANEVNMSLYPNPTHGTDVNINLSGITSDNVQIRVVDAMGRQVWSNRYAIDGILNTNIKFEQPLANGLYFVEAIFNGEVQTQRLMVQK